MYEAQTIYFINDRNIIPSKEFYQAKNKAFMYSSIYFPSFSNKPK